MTGRPNAQVPTYAPDIFSRAALADPFGHYRAIRNLGPVVRLGEDGLLALGRFEDVQKALRTPEILVSGRGVGLSAIMNENQPPNLLNTDGEVHSRLRMGFMKPLTPAAIKGHRQSFRALVDRQVRSCVGIGWFDGVEQLARFLPLTVISHLIGLPEDARSRMLAWATAGFDLQQPFKPELAEAVPVFLEAMQFLATVERGQLKPGSWSEQLYQQADNGKMTLAEAAAAVGGYALPSLDTTIHSKSGMLYFLGSNPDQWQILRQDPSLISSAVLESVRASSVVRWFTRVAATDYRAGEVFVPQGERVALLYGCANRDERRYEDPDSFDVRRNPTDNLGWGTGPHMCAGMHLAKLEMEVLLEALIEHVDGIEVAEPVPSSNGGLFGFEFLQMRLTGK
ncbi:MAG: cytochrome P450 [Novosphingobium sp.]